MSLSAIFTETYYFFKNHIKQLAILTVPLLLVQVTLQFWLGGQVRSMDMDHPDFGSGHMFAMMVLLIIFSLLISALTLFMQWRSEGHQPSVPQVLVNSLHFVPPLLLASVFSGMAIMAPVMVLAAFGPLWVIGLLASAYIFARLAYVNFMIVTERLTPLKAISASFKFSGPLAFKTMSVLMLYIPFSLIGGAISSVFHFAGMPVQIIIETVISFFALFINVALFRLYMVNRAPQTKAAI